MSKYQIQLNMFDRNYTEWSFLNTENNQLITTIELPILNELHPLEYKLLHGDVIEVSVDNLNDMKIIHSSVKTSKQIAGVLVLENNKTFGRTQNKKRLLYKCIPDDTHLPTFLIPYDIKLGFSKVQTNKFVVFTFDNWSDKHPYGILSETIGDVDNMEAFYEYQLYCKNLHISLTEFTNKTKNILKRHTNHDEYIQQIFQNSNFDIEDRRDKYVFSIDPPNSLDFDDAFSIEPIISSCTKNSEQIGWKVTVYIANVYVWLETLGLWDAFSQRVSTIYLPDRKRPMLPTILSDSLCSLQQNQLRFALAMDFMIDMKGQLCTNMNSNINEPFTYKNVLIRVAHNYAYENPKMIHSDTSYQQLFIVSNKMDTSIINSHDLVAHWMIQMNIHTGTLMVNRKIGIFRTAVFINPYVYKNIETDLPLKEDTERLIRNWNNTMGQYVNFKEDINLTHEIMNIDKSKNITSYIHITSPIRRLVDLLNQMILFQELGLVKTMSIEANTFLSKWLSQMDNINSSMRSIRKIQIDTDVLNRCTNKPEMLESIHDGVVFDKIIKNNGSIGYIVYLENINMLSRIKTYVDIPDYSRAKFKIFLFEDEDKINKKIRLQIVT